MSEKESSSRRTFGSSVRGSVPGSDTQNSRSRTHASVDQSFNVESSRHSYPKTPGAMPIAYGQHQDSAMPPRGADTFSHHPTQPLMHALPGGGGMSPFFGNAPSAPGFPVPPPVQGGIMPLPYNASNPSPAASGYMAAMPPHAYTHSGALYQPYDYHQRAHTTGSLYGGTPQPMNLTPPSTSYSTPYDQSAQVEQKKSNADYADDCFNIFWLFFLLGPLTWVCGLFGICSDKQSERIAGFVSGICLILVVIAAVIVITQTPNDSGSEGDS